MVKHHYSDKVIVERDVVSKRGKKGEDGYRERRVNWGVIFNSTLDFVEEGSGSKVHEEYGRASRRERDGDDDWAGGTWKQACDLAQYGWPEGREKAEGMAEVMEAQLGLALQPTFSRIMDVSGVEPDVPMYLAGEPECMVDYHLVERARAGRVVRVFIDISASGGFGVDVLEARAAAVLALCESINRQGDTVEVWVGETINPSFGRGTSKNKGNMLMAVAVQRAGDPFDGDALAFWCGHPSVLRRFMFAAQERLPKEAVDQFGFHKGSGYGGPVGGGCEKWVNKYLVGITGEFDIVINNINDGAKIKAGRVNWKKDGHRVDWVREQMEQVGFTIEQHEDERV